MIQTLCAFSDVLMNILYVLAALCMLMFMIVVHEFGHYLAGRKLGFQINEFAIGFGPPIFKRKSKKCGQFSIRPIPLGGFCAFEGEDDDSENPGAFNNKAPWKRIIVLFAGAFFNFVSAMIIITIFFSAYGESVSVVSTLYPDGEAIRSQTVQEGDIILSVNGKTKHILTSDDFTDMFESCGDTAEIKVLRDGKTLKFTIKKGAYSYVAPIAEADFYQILRIVDNQYVAVNILPTDKLVSIGGKNVSRMDPDELQQKKQNIQSSTELVFERNGEEISCFVTVVKKGDRLRSIDGVFLPAVSDAEYAELLSKMKQGSVIAFGQTLTIDGMTGNYSVPILVDSSSICSFSGSVISDFGADYISEDFRFTAVSPDAENPDGLETYGFGFTRQLSNEKLGFFRSLGRSFTYSFFVVFKILALLGALITGKMSLASAGGPITVISTVSSGLAQGGMPYLIYITCILSANLAVMNLLPIPALDGSKIVFTAIEWIRGKPINRKVEAIIHTIGLVLLFGFTIFIDIFHMVS